MGTHGYCRSLLDNFYKQINFETICSVTNLFYLFNYKVHMLCLDDIGDTRFDEFRKTLRWNYIKFPIHFDLIEYKLKN